MNKKIKKLVYLESTKENSYKLFYNNSVYMGDIYMEIDGYYVWLPNPKQSGSLGEYFLFAVAYTLLDLNKKWDRQIQNDINI